VSSLSGFIKVISHLTRACRNEGSRASRHASLISRGIANGPVSLATDKCLDSPCHVPIIRDPPRIRCAVQPRRTRRTRLCQNGHRPTTNAMSQNHLCFSLSQLATDFRAFLVIGQAVGIDIVPGDDPGGAARVLEEGRAAKNLRRSLCALFWMRLDDLIINRLIQLYFCANGTLRESVVLFVALEHHFHPSNAGRFFQSRQRSAWRSEKLEYLSKVLQL